MKNLISTAAVISATLLLVGCPKDDDKPPQTNLQAVHASSDAPRANVLINGTKELDSVDYAQASGYLSLDEGSNSIQVDVQLPGGELFTAIPNSTFDLSSDTDYTVMVVGDVAANSVDALVVTRPADGEADSTTLDLQVVHAAFDIPDVNVIVTGPATGGSPTTLATLGYEAFTGVLNIEAGYYQIQLEAGNAIVFDSGIVSLAAGSELTVAAVKTGDSSSKSPVKLIVMDGSGSSIINDINEVAEVRIGHLVSDAPAVDVDVTGPANQALAAVTFQTITPFLDLPASGTYDISIVDNATRTADILSAPGVSFEAGMDYSVYASGQVALNNISPLVVVEERRPVATSAVVNITHAAANPAAATVDIFINGDLAVSDFPYKEVISGVYLAEGSYDIDVAPAGAGIGSAVISATIPLVSGEVYQIIAIDDSTSSTGFGAIALPTITD
ncbi:DUF4397 domain-containing protein [Vibrio maerlii]|uniref:DUF4397 domain-containing protein n=1 Tax=Vibrio maerlii TaxID=2231648 RepID=UPI000E3CCD88|nr:DUF4397 domain-containing protein [Vibrio maerlii]